MGYQSIIVVFLVREVGVGPGTVGVLIAGASAGGVLGAFAGRRVADRIGTARATLFFELGLPTAALLIPLTTSGYGVLLYLTGGFCVGAGVVAGNVIKSTFQQEYCAPEFRGRLAATGSFVNLGTIPLGSALGGLLGTAFDLRTALWIGTAGVPLAGLILLFSPIRRLRDLPLDGQIAKNQLPRNQIDGNQIAGNQAHGTHAQGTQAHGNQARGNQARGNQAQGSGVPEVATASSRVQTD
jgi:MFS family permease